VYGHAESYVELTKPGGLWERLVYEKSNGRLLIDNKPRLFPTKEILPAVGQGKVDVGFFPSAFMAGTYPLFNYGAIPGLFDNIYEEWAVTSDPRVRELFNKAYREIGAVWLCDLASVANEGIWAAERKVDTVEKFKGLKARTSGFIQTKTLEVLGASPVTISITELEQALYRGTVDAITTGLTYGWLHGLTDLCKYVNVWPMVTPGFTFPWVMNAEAFDSLPADLQKAIVDATEEATYLQYYGMICDRLYGLQGIAMTGCEIVNPSEAEIAKGKELTKPVRDEWLKIAGPYGAELLKYVDEDVANYRAFAGK